MPLYTVRIKWGKEKYDGVQLDTDELPIMFKMQLFSLTGVPPERQKVMIAGTTLGDDEWGKSISKIKPNCTLMLMGSATELPKEPEQKPRFIEDMTDEELATALDLPTGLRNLGNTCYMNATIQCINAVPELRDILKSFNPGLEDGMLSLQLTAHLGSLFKSLEIGAPDLPLLLFLKSLHAVKPHFAEKDENTGVFHQQDAHECWSAIMTNISEASSSVSGNNSRSIIEQYFGLKFQTTYKCVESVEEMETEEAENAFQVSCYIGQDIKYLHTGLLKGLEGSIEKTSPSLGRNAQYTKRSLISRLPGYLTVQYVRFFYGRAGESEETISKKILKDVKFSLKLDMYDFCVPELQEKLLVTRRKFKDVEDQKLALKAQKIAAGPSAAKNIEIKVSNYESVSFDDDPGSNNSGYYNLLAVLTHKGRSSSSGHYLAWIRHASGQWLKFDDDEVSAVTEEDILKLSGGGDWHTAYILLYSSRQLEILPTPEESTAS